MTHTNPAYDFKYPRVYTVDTTKEYDPNAANIFDDDQFSTSVSVSGTLESYSLIITGIETTGISTGQYIKTIDEVIQPGTSVLSIGIGSVFINQESLNADSVTTNFEFGSYPLYSEPGLFPDLQTDNLLVNDYLFMQGPLYDKTDYSGKLGEILLTDGTAVFWRDISGLGTPLQTIGIWDENLFQGIVANLNFIDGNDPDNLVKAEISGISTKFADIIISDR